MSGDVTGVLEVPADFKPSSLVGKAIRVTRGESSLAEETTIQRAYTLPYSLRLFGGQRKRVKFVAG